MKYLKQLSCLFVIICFSSSTYAGKPIVEKVTAECNQQRICKFNVTLSHADEGWTHFANGWEILSPTGELLGRRALAHPHVNEQPFTRTIRNISIPESIDTVSIKAHDSVHGVSDRKYLIKLNFKTY